MGGFSVQGIVTRAADYMERDKILTVFTPRGFVSAKARGVRKSESKLKSLATVPTLAEFAFVSAKGGRHILAGGEPIDNFFSCWGDRDKMSAMFACFDLAEKCFGRDDDTAEEYVELLKAVKEMAYGSRDPYETLLKYAVYCAERSGVEYDEIGEYRPEEYAIALKARDAGRDGASEAIAPRATLESALRALAYVFKKALGVDLRVPETPARGDEKKT